MKKLLPFVLLLCSIYVHAQPFTFVFLNQKADATELPQEQVDKLMEGHMANITRLAREGKLISAGPFDGGGGIFIFKSKSVEEVKDWLSTDPGVRANRWNIEILPYQPRYGSACAVSEPYEMVSYHFVRYVANLTKYTIQDAPITFTKHDDYLKKVIQTGNVIAEGVFGDREGGILVLKGELQKEVIENDPSVNEGLFEIQFKKLYIARGAFCEK